MENFAQFVNDNLMMIYLLIFLGILGFVLISNVSTILHTPLMSGANAISGIVIVGAILIIRRTPPDDYITLAIALLAIILGIINVVGGFSVTNRMLQMFKKKVKE